MNIEAMKQALEALETPRPSDDYPPILQAYAKTINDAITSLRQAIQEEALRNVQRLGQEIEAEAKKQEPVAWMDSDWHYQLHKKGMVVIHKDEGDVLIGEPQPLYTHPPQRTWAGLTDEEFEQLLVDAKFTRSDLLMIGTCVEDICNMVEAKLKEKNT